ncbi:hypothetical protein QR680_009018 [Steinernema hermaphroditum]|uniref:Uncharacterized protein n=1 Tax=Steinernema hermaphroditum TaxID=289476 RepID=A0AA39IL36_9BILA|nr:hypothetical protein QR680_009018 [Steinernema hermaphroditum]
MGRFDALLCLLLCLEGVLSQDPQEIGFHRVNLKEGETFLLTLSDLPLLGSVMVSVESPQISLEVHIASPEERRSALGNFGLVEGDYSPYFRDFGRISALSGWHNNMWTAETTHKAMTITRFHGVEAVSADDSFRHVALFRAKLFRIDDVRCLHNVLHAALPGELRSQSFFSGFLHCPRFLLSNFPVTTLSAFSLKGCGGIVASIQGFVSGKRIGDDFQSAVPWETVSDLLPRPGHCALLDSDTGRFLRLADRTSTKCHPELHHFHRGSRKPEGEQPGRLPRSGLFPVLRRSIETFELSSPSPLLYHLYIADITENANFNLSTEYGSIFVKKYPGWTVDLFVSRVRLDYLETGERGFLLRYSVSKNIMEQSFLRGVPYSTRPEDSGLILWIR